LLFDSRVSLSGDDSFYIIRAYDFIHSFKYPAFQGPLYPMVLSLFVGIFGISLIPLKIVSVLAMLGFIYLFFIAFRTRIPSSLLMFTLLIISINSFILYYSSQTYNEAFYLLMQALMLWVFFRKFIDLEQSHDFRSDLKRHLLLASTLLALVLTKNAGYSAVLAIVGYFLLKQQWKNLGYSILAFALLMVVFQGIKYTLWNEGSLQFSTQGSGLMNKDYYNPQAGKEDLAGFFVRLVDNSKIYLSSHFMSILGFRKAVPGMPVSTFTTVLVYILALGGLILTFIKNKYIFFTGLLTGSFLIVSFIILQTKWDQSRLIIPAIPTLILLLFSCVYYVSRMKQYKWLQVAVPLLAGIILLQSFAVTANAVKANREINGRYGGLTPDWKNYLKASEWAADNLPKDAVIACRKPSISFIYGNGRNFFGIMQLPVYSLDAFYKNWTNNESSYMAFNYADLSGKQLTQEQYLNLKQNMVALLLGGDSVYIIEKVTDSARVKLLDLAIKTDCSYKTNVNGLKAGLSNAADTKIYYPDSLLDQLNKSGVTHVITANLRRNSNVKDGKIINTVERYMAFIQEKYPDIYTKISQVGVDDNEPATVFRIEYEKYGRTVLPSNKK